MILASKINGVNSFQENQTSKLIIDNGLHLDLFTKCSVNIVRIDKDKDMGTKENIPSQLVLTNPVFSSVHIIKLITEVN